MVNGKRFKVNVLSQAAIGRALDMSPANVTKLKKQGMPVDSVESAQAWREARQNVAARKTAPEPIAPLHTYRAMDAAPTSPIDPDTDRMEPTRGDYFRDMIRANEVAFNGSELSEDHDAARTRLRISEANLSEMEEAEMRGSLIRVDAVKASRAVTMATAREALLQIPSRLAPLLAADTDPASVQNLLHAEIHQALAQLAGASERLGQPVVDVE